MKKTNLKNNKGITLIALIITIIMLLILATVSIKLVMDSGIIKHAENATNKYQIEEEKEKIGLGYTEYQITKANNENSKLTVDGATVTGEETNGWTITFNKTGNRYKLDSQGKSESKPKTEEEKLLEKYFLGENGETKLLTDVMLIERDSMTFIDVEGAIIPNGSEVFNFLNLYDDGTHVYVVLKYENKVYCIQCDYETYENQAVECVYEPQGREGKTVKYSYDGKLENEKVWTILYDHGDTVEIICPEALESLELGYKDDTEKSIDSYNNAVKRLNEYASSLVTNNNKISVRSVGSNPKNSQSEGAMYRTENLSKWAEGKYNGRGKSADLNFVQDLIRMNYHDVINTVNGQEYWLASRYIQDEGGSDVLFEVSYATSEGFMGRDFLCRISNGTTVNAWGYSHTHAVRPIVKVDSSKVTIVE